MIFKKLFLWTNVASALEGLRVTIDPFMILVIVIITVELRMILQKCMKASFLVIFSLTFLLQIFLNDALA